MYYEDLNELQNMAMKYIEKGRNVFLTGPAGTGKTYTLKKVIEWATCKRLRFGITATTGCAAILIGGQTLHSFLGIGLAKKPVETLYRYMDSQTVKKLKDLQFLIIDEISMLNNDIFTKVSHLFCMVKRRREPFGGMQVLVCGDFCQLPPVEPDYAFMCDEWNRTDFQTVYLSESFRQIGDSRLFELLQRARWGKLSKEDIDILYKVRDNPPEDGDIRPTKLYSLNSDVDRINMAEYKKLVDEGSESMDYISKYSCKDAKDWADSCNVPGSVKVCEGCQVVLTRNLNTEDGLVNGSRGIVLRVERDGALVKFKNGVVVKVGYARDKVEDHNKEEEKKEGEEEKEGEKKKVAKLVTVDYLPLRLAYALTIHKSQGMTLDSVEIDLGPSIFSAGQAYTALSRAKSIKSVYLTRFIPSAFKADPEVVRFYEKK